MGKNKEDGSVSCTRYFLIILHVLFLVVGVILITIGVWIYSIPGTKNVIEVATEDTTTNQLHNVSLVVIVTGATVAVVSLVGFVGTVNNNRCILMMISILFVVLLLIEVTIAAVGFLFRDQIYKQVINEMSSTFILYEGDSATDTNSVAWREIQTSFACCGVTGYKDHVHINVTMNGSYVIGSAWYRNIGMNLNQEWPGSCCLTNKLGQVVNSTTCYADAYGNNNLRKQGCHTKATQFLSNHLLLISILVITVGCIEMGAVVLSCKMYTYVSQKEFRVF
uniref:Tetraspanin n=1 Tax=Ciona savignyi TaxID=51511 RepID=H2Z507_CIOSA